MTTLIPPPATGTRIVSLKNVYETVRFSPRGDYLFLCNYKVASTTLLLRLARREFDAGLLATMPDEEIVHGNMPPWPWTFAWGRSQPFAFGFVRNPYARALAGYLDKIAPEYDPVGASFRVSHGLASDTRLSFRDFLALVRDRSPAQEDAHWRLQAHNLLLGGLRLDFVGHLEHLDEDYERLRTMLDLGPEVEPAGREHATRAAERIAAYYGRDEIALVDETFEPDFQAFGYRFDPTALEPVGRQLLFAIDDPALHHFIRGVGLHRTDPDAARAEWQAALQLSEANVHVRDCLETLSVRPTALRSGDPRADR
jgi:hypothetical protein